MNCPKCKSENVSVYNSRRQSEYTWRRRFCEDCGHKYSTAEITVDEYKSLKKKETDLNWLLGLIRKNEG